MATTGDDRACLVIRRAGDWTERLAADPPTHLYVRRMRGLGFMYHARTYRRALIVATGAGIGPVLPYVLQPCACSSTRSGSAATTAPPSATSWSTASSRAGMSI